MEKNNLEKVRIHVFKLIVMLIGAFIISIGINGFYIPNNILSGGVSGIAILLDLMFGIHISITIIILNIPIFIIGYKFISKEYIIYSLIGTVALSIFISLTGDITFKSEELLTTILLGGILNGVGFGLIFRVSGSTGGVDIISKVLNRKFSYSISTLSFAFNLIIIGLSVIFFGVDMAVVTLTTMYITAITTKFILEGTNYKRTVFIVTTKKEEVGMQINTRLLRGCTSIEGTGSFTGGKRDILYAIISINQVAKLKEIVREVDPDALINVIETRVVFGNGKGFVNINAND